jgi:hypothetical protein
MNDMSATAEVKSATALIRFDISAAFKKICHRVIIDRLEGFGLLGRVIA